MPCADRRRTGTHSPLFYKTLFSEKRKGRPTRPTRPNLNNHGHFLNYDKPPTTARNRPTLACNSGMKKAGHTAPALPNISKQARELRAITPMALPHAPPHIGTVDSGSCPASRSCPKSSHQMMQENDPRGAQVFDAELLTPGVQSHESQIRVIFSHARHLVRRPRSATP
jgi:hypothetical protein